MTDKLDFLIASSTQIESVLCRRIARIRLDRNITQRQLADEAGVSLRTVARMEHGEGVSLDTFIRVLGALGLVNHLAGLLPDPTVRPIERVRSRGHLRQRARPKKGVAEGRWKWGADTTDD